MDATVETILLFKGVAVGLWLALWFGWERLAPAAHEWIAGGAADEEAKTAAGRRKGRLRRWARNAVLFAINSALSPAIVIPLSAYLVQLGPDWRPDWLTGAFGGWGQLAFDILLLDLFIYAWHRVNHEIPLLWRFHQVHHFDKHLDVTTAVRFHFGEVLLSAVTRGVFVALMDIPLTSVVLFEVVLLFCSIFQHSNARLPAGVEKALSAIIITPGIHWVHHHAVRADTDSNYGTLFSFWDRLFGSRSPTARWADMPIGLVGEKRDLTLLELLLVPLKTRQ